MRYDDTANKVLIKSLVLFPSFRLHLLPSINEEVWN
jgi:hypothetical protein